MTIYDRGGSNGRHLGSAGDAPSARVWQPSEADRATVTRGNTAADFSGLRAPRTPIPVLSGSSSSARGPGSARLRAAEDALRRAGSQPAANARADQTRPPSIRTPALSRDGLLERYRGSETLGGSTEARNRPELSRGRLKNSTPAQRAVKDGRDSVSRRDGASGRTASGRRIETESESAARIARFRRTNPEGARQADAASTAIARVSSVTAGLSIGFGLGFGCGTGGLWFWEPGCPSFGGGWHHGSYGWWWNNCSWWWWPWWTTSWCSNWYWGSPWWWHSSYAWCPSPYAYSSVVYVDDPDPAPVVVYVDAPAQPQYEDSALPPPDNAPSGDAVSSPLPETSRSMARSAEEYLVKGDDAFREGRFGDAVQHYARATEYDPQNGAMWLILSDALFATGDYHYCAFALRKALELDRALLDTTLDKTNFYADPAQFERQLVLAEGYLQEHFLDEDARLVLAANYLFSNRPAQALDLLESAFSVAVRESPAGKLLLERAAKLKAERAGKK